ncbi:MAG: NADH-quinone oxidoreductase subunit NuoF [Candidatus Promineofilum sp.]|nr:NADH-quinone oxidoreductase subunit NuoF [Promineifilum sp.]MCW5862031.1 NADH-quinone oxidoreductase subunit NuoF [Anaerolineae bacterium]
MYERLEEITLAEQESTARFSHTVNVCMAAGCMSSRSDAIKDALTKEVEANGLERWCRVRGVGCMGLCAHGPLVSVDTDQSAETLYQYVTPDDAPAIVGALEGPPVERLHCPTNVPFFQRQKKIVLENSGRIDPERVEEYIAADGYTALIKAITEMSPAEVIDEIIASGLRGRGGGGYPTGLKWTTVAKSEGDTKYVICNADEGDPGAFMDRSVLESDPHRILEGMAIAGYAIGAGQGYIYVRGEYPLAVARLKTAIRQARRVNMLGSGIAGTQFAFHVDIRLGAGAFVCGEETALIASIEGKRGQPRPRPPYPAEYGLWGQPTLINNVETLANVAPIIRNGGDWYASLGTAKSKGTKVFALAGSINNTGLIEVPMGTPLREIIYEIGGGVSGGGQCKAIQTGGPSGGCIPAEFLDTPVDYESLAALGSIMGSGGMIVMDESASMVDVARYFMEFCMTESCGRCVPCRVGTVHMHNLLDKFSHHEAAPRDLVLLEKLCDMVRNTSLCGLGQTAPNPVLSTLRYFRHEYIAAITEEAADLYAITPAPPTSRNGATQHAPAQEVAS